MKINQVVRFHDENFFEGAVQLGWVNKRITQAEQAAKAFVFHGPKYHGAGTAEADGLESSYRLKDTASFVKDLLASIEDGTTGKEVNPYWLAVAGYGSGKSHLALTAAILLASPKSDTANSILQHIKQADDALGSEVEQQLKRLDKPALVLPLDGMSGFHLGNALSQAVFSQFEQLGIDAEAIRSLSPRFKTATQFAERNYPIRQDVFAKHLPGLTIEQISERLGQNDETVYSAVDNIYQAANGSHIPVEGQESAQELIETLANVYCSDDGPFSQVIILFDEFGRYLEYAAEKPNLAGDSALQQIFQGIQDNSSKARFIGFIQYELKTYLKRFSGVDLRQLQRYVTRFDAAEKWYLSSNLETIFAHMIGKDEQVLEQLWSETSADQQAQISWERLAANIPGFNRYPVWNDAERFKSIIARGCWPLHPAAVWFLSRQRDVVQSRSALTFIRDIIERTSGQEAQANQRIRQISVAELIIHNLLPELIAAERETGGTTAETLQGLLDRFSGHIAEPEQLILAGIAALEKMRVGKKTKVVVETLLCEATALSEQQLSKSIQGLSELGAIEWNQDLGQYELLSDGASRGQFQQWLRKQLAGYKASETRDLFIRNAATTVETLQEIRPDFAKSRHISTTDWFFERVLAHSGNLESTIKNAFTDWKNATLPNEAKGKVIYLYLHSEDDSAAIQEKAHAIMAEQLSACSSSKAPVWIIALDDRQSVMAEHLAKLHLFEEGINGSDKERYRRFLASEQQRSQQALKEAAEDAIRERSHWAAGFSEIPAGRLAKIGNAIFEAIYPSTLLFPFDGFSSSTGNGGADVARLAKSLITHQVNPPWLQAQEKRLQNRTDYVLSKAWQVLLPGIKLCEPKNASVRAIYDWLETQHRNQPERSLYDSYQALLAPPYGLNAASASLLMALFLGMETPPRRIEYNGELIASAEWLSLVYKSGKGKNYFETAVLSKSRVRFLSEDSESRWRTLLNKWDAEGHYGKKLVLSQEAEKLIQLDPLAESLEGKFRYLQDETSKINSELLATKSRIEKWEREIESAVSRESVRHAIKCAKKIQYLIGEMEQSELWPEELIAECKTLLPLPIELIQQSIANWIPRQICNGYANVSNFREKNESAARDLTSLGFKRESKALVQQTQHSISRVEIQQRYKLTLDESEDFPRQPAPDNSTPVRQLRDQISHGKGLIESLQTAKDALTPEEISARCEAINKRITALEQAVASRRDELSQLYNAPDNEQGLKDALLKAKRVQALFVGTPDESAVSELIVQIERMLSDLEEWETENNNPRRIQELISKQIEQQLNDFNAFLEQEEFDSLWDTKALYEKCLADRIAQAVRKSEHWITMRLLTDSELHQQTHEQCKRLRNELVQLPDFLADTDRETALISLEQVELRIAEFEEVKRSEAAKTWLGSLVKLEEVANLGQYDIKQQLNKLKELPSCIGQFEQSYVEELKQTLTKLLDQLSIDDIIDRIQHLTNTQKQEILAKLKNMLH